MHEDESSECVTGLGGPLTLFGKTQKQIEDLLGRTPSTLELAVFSIVEIDENAGVRKFKLTDEHQSFLQFSKRGLPRLSPTKPAFLKKNPNFSTKKINSPKKIKDAAKSLFLAPNLVRAFVDIYKEEDKVSKSTSCIRIVPLKEMENVISISASFNPEQIKVDPVKGIMVGIIRSLRKTICSGASPLAILPILDFGNLNNPENYWYFLQVKKGIEEMSDILKIPILNYRIKYSLNENSFDERKFLSNSAIFTVGQLGNIEDEIPKDFQKSGDQIYMIGNAQNDLTGSEYIRSVKKIKVSPCPHVDLQCAYDLNRHLLNIIDENIPSSIHEIGRGGLFINLMKSALFSGLGFNIETIHRYRRDAFLFGESQNRVVLTTSDDKEEELLNYLIANNVAFAKLGEVFGNEIVIDGENYGDIEEWKALHLEYLRK